MQFAAWPELHQDQELDQWARQGDVYSRTGLKLTFFIKIEPLAPVSAIERHLVMKGFGQPQTESSSGPEDNMSDSDDDAEATPVIIIILVIT